MPSSAWKKDVCSRSEEHTSELQSLTNLVCRLLLEKNIPRGGAVSGGRMWCVGSRSSLSERSSPNKASHPTRQCVRMLRRSLSRRRYFFFLKIRQPPKTTLLPLPPAFPT